MEKIVSLCKKRGFIFQSSEIYGGINGFWDYGPLGAELKKNVKDYWWRCMTHFREDVVGLDATIIMHPKIWQASGHVETFCDKMVDDPVSKKRYRADQVDEMSGVVYFYSGAKSETTGKESAEPFSVMVPFGKPPESARKVANQYYEQRSIDKPLLAGERSEKVELSTLYSPDSGARLSDPRDFNLMLKTYVGPTATEDNVAYLRPETAQAIFAQFKNVVDTSRMKVPFGIAQMGKAFRNEVTPKNFTFRSREFEQMELEFFIKPDEIVLQLAGNIEEDVNESTPLPNEPQQNWGWKAWHIYWVQQRLNWYESIGLSRDSLVLYWQTETELAHYARACVDILYKFPFGTQELEGIAARSNFDLTQHQKFSGKSMEVFDEDAKSKYLAHVIEPSAGADRLVLALICQAYAEEEVTDEKGNKESRTVLRFHPRVAPIKAAVLPLVKNKPHLLAKAREVLNLLRPHMNVFWDESGAIGRRYRRQDEAGTPYCITIDFETLEGVRTGDELGAIDTVTLRHRDSMKQERLSINELLPFLLNQIR